ncbi:hypothetical protein DPMN_078297 [Dreissena polymorpha]|uniref:Uncharacterized protein n=1 Tax=Dreissena polymorpha TaxID=45954 RepID=A0A9D3YQV2_DREPO|nr:hypothetical protein DPMN_078297 [Dreissena polymorpha]
MRLPRRRTSHHRDPFDGPHRSFTFAKDYGYRIYHCLARRRKRFLWWGADNMKHTLLGFDKEKQKIDVDTAFQSTISTGPLLQVLFRLYDDISDVVLTTLSEILAFLHVYRERHANFGVTLVTTDTRAVLKG